MLGNVLKLLALTLWLLAFTLVLFVLATDVWQGAPILHFVGAVILGMIGPTGTWAIARGYPETDRFAWWSLLIMAWFIALLVLCRLLILP
jgi:hypothetical protein